MYRSNAHDYSRRCSTHRSYPWWSQWVSRNYTRRMKKTKTDASQAWIFYLTTFRLTDAMGREISMKVDPMLWLRGKCQNVMHPALWVHGYESLSSTDNERDTCVKFTIFEMTTWSSDNKKSNSTSPTPYLTRVWLSTRFYAEESSLFGHSDRISCVSGAARLRTGALLGGRQASLYLLTSPTIPFLFLSPNGLCTLCVRRILSVRFFFRFAFICASVVSSATNAHSSYSSDHDKGKASKNERKWSQQRTNQFRHVENFIYHHYQRDCKHLTSFSCADGVNVLWLKRIQATGRDRLCTNTESANYSNANISSAKER